ncbi:MAG TPA: hypothetical protein VH144_01335 [Candidatus Saccharimonadales bacterium]|jgi:hypothetical protein|nr:hypothetical protein [Candidatus Saccharimonadales bacterium]
MKKDVIYIDTEDDITSIIEKVKAASAKVVALVPPKRTGVLQSVVNLKLLQRAAQNNDHHIVLITNDNALTALAAGISIPVAKNLQSKPEVAPLSAVEVDDDDIINGDELPIGELAKTADASTVTAAAALASTPRLPDDESLADAAKTVPKPPIKDSLSSKSAIPKPKSGRKVPNFESFRKRLFLIIGGAVVLIIFLVWAIFFAPHATVTITAKTTPVNIAKDLVLDPAITQTDATMGKIKPLVAQTKKTASATFNTTGSKDIGAKATGSLTLSNATNSDPVTIPAGTTFIASNNTQFTNDATVTVPGAKIKNGSIVAGTASAAITAANIGPDYNVGPQSFTTNAPVSASSSQATAGGSKQTVQVVAQADVDTAKTQLAQQDQNAVKAELRKQFTGDVVIISESFTTAQAQPTLTPNVGEQATQGKISIDTTYTMVAVNRTDIKKVLDASLTDSLKGKQNQQIYDSGDHDLTFSQFVAGANNTFSVKANTVGSVGPEINADKLAAQLAGKRFGEIQQIVTGVDGVSDVKVDFSPFWVSTAPGADKIDIKFKISNVSN